MFTKSVIALAVIIGVTSSAASPSFANQHHPRAHATDSAQVPWRGHNANDYGAFALAPHSRLPASKADERAPVPLPRALYGTESWDAYGQRWE
jgi:hypothetical protein